MWYPAVVTTQPSAEPISRADAKRHLRAEFYTDDDTYIDNLISAARDHVERYTGTQIAEKTVRISCDRFVDFADVPLAPVQDVSVQYVDSMGNAQTLPETIYELRCEDLRTEIVLKHGQRWPATQYGSRITVEVITGYDPVPPALRHAMLLWIAGAFEVREDAPSGGRSVFDDLLTNFRR